MIYVRIVLNEYTKVFQQIKDVHSVRFGFFIGYLMPNLLEEQQ